MSPSEDLSVTRHRARANTAAAIVAAIAVVSAGCRSHEEPARHEAVFIASSGVSAPERVTPAPEPPPSRPACPDGMALVPGGRFWVGSEPGTYSDNESPRYETELASFCMDETEVTVAAYLDAVRGGHVDAPDGSRFHCNARRGIARADRERHPMNCVTWHQADGYCRNQGKRLPREVEWEYAARGGASYLVYPWGEGSPDGRACWKHHGTCAVKSFAPGAFGLYDLSGNVWEWTSDWYGAYPWPPQTAFAKVYRGGSFSRRFEKWMHTRLRNRDKPSSMGSHLGFRCARDVAGAPCPFGQAPDGGCLHGVHGRSCKDGRSWNGVRCAGPDEPRCPADRTEVPGHGCILAEASSLVQPPEPVDLAAVTRTRSPEFDADCQANDPVRVHSYRYVGATHRARNLASAGHGCKNRDVGVGHNSCCCP